MIAFVSGFSIHSTEFLIPSKLIKTKNLFREHNLFKKFKTLKIHKIIDSKASLTLKKLKELKVLEWDKLNKESNNL